MTDPKPYNLNQSAHLIVNEVIRRLEGYLWAHQIGVNFGSDGRAIVEQLVQQYSAELERLQKEANHADDLAHDMGAFAYCGLNFDKGDMESIRSEEGLELLEVLSQCRDERTMDKYHLGEAEAALTEARRVILAAIEICNSELDHAHLAHGHVNWKALKDDLEAALAGHVLDKRGGDASAE